LLIFVGKLFGFLIGLLLLRRQIFQHGKNFFAPPAWFCTFSPLADQFPFSGRSGYGNWGKGR